MNQEEIDRPSKIFESAFGARLRDLRGRLPLDKLAERMAAHGSYFDGPAISKLERAVRKEILSAREIVAAAKALEIPEYFLLLDADTAALVHAYRTGGLAGVLAWATDRARAASAPSQNAR